VVLGPTRDRGLFDFFAQLFDHLGDFAGQLFNLFEDFLG
jgi:hypothetical protein